LRTVSGRTRAAAVDAAVTFGLAQDRVGRIEGELGDYTAEVLKDVSAVAPNTSSGIGSLQGETKVIDERL